MEPAQPSRAEPLRISDPKVVACGIAYGGQLSAIEPKDDGRLVFVLTGLPADFLMRLANDKVQVSGRSFISAMEGVLSVISERQRQRRRGGRW